MRRAQPVDIVDERVKVYRAQASELFSGRLCTDFSLDHDVICRHGVHSAIARAQRRSPLVEYPSGRPQASARRL